MTGRKVLGSGCLLLLGLVLVFLAAIAVTPDKREGVGAVYFVLGLLATLLAYISWRFLRTPPKTFYQWDLLRHSFHLQAVPEKGGVQWTMLAFPDTLQVPGHVVLALLVQNCHNAPRGVKIDLHDADSRVQAVSREFRLQGGEAGVYRIPLQLDGNLREGPLHLEFAVDAATDGEKGRRVIETPGVAPRVASQFRQVTLEILPGKPPAPLNEFARDWSGFQPMFRTGQGEPDLEPLRLLEELKSTS
jgi:hypothetical protein